MLMNQEQMGVRGGVVNLIMAFVILLSSFAAADSQINETAQEQSQLNVIGGSEDINDDMAERLWRNCRLDLINIKESVEDFELNVGDSNGIDSCRRCAKEITEKTSSAVDPQLKQNLLNCLRKKNLMFLPRPDTPKRRKLVQSCAEEPAPSPGLTSPNVDPPCSNHEVGNTHRTSGPPPLQTYSRPDFRDSSVQRIVVVQRASVKGGNFIAATAAAAGTVAVAGFLCCCCLGAEQKDEAPLLSLSVSNSSAGSSRKSFANSINNDNPGNQSLRLSLSFNDNFYLESDILNNAEESVQTPPSPVKISSGRLDTQLCSLRPPLTTQASMRPPAPGRLNSQLSSSKPPSGRLDSQLSSSKPPSGRLDSQLSSSKPPLGKLGSQKSSNKPPLGKLNSQNSSKMPPLGNGAPPPPSPDNGTPTPPPPGIGEELPPSALLNPSPGAPRPAGPPPPLAPGGGGPRPPPPPGGAGPAPPPPPGGAPRPPGMRPLKPGGPPPFPGAGEAGTPKAKLKPFFWDKVSANPDSTMVWHQLKAGSFQFNEEMIESLFGFNADTNKNAPKKDSSSQDSGPQFIQLIDQKKSQNLAILLKALNVTTDEVCDALQEGSQLPAELVRTLIKMAPTQEEELKLRLYTDDVSRLGSAEQFLKVIVDIPFAFKRLETLLFMRSLQEETSVIKESFATLEAACIELRKSRLFLKLLEAVLKTGNRMNVGTYRGSAQAFKLDTLLKLSDVKGTDGKITLLHFVIQEIIRSEGLRAARNARESQSSISSISSMKSDDLLEDSSYDSEEYLRELGLNVVLGLGDELENVKKAAVLDADSITGTVSELGHSLIKARDFLNGDMKSIDEENGFRKTLKNFIQNAEGDIFLLLEEEKRIMALMKSTADYFHGNAKKDEGLRLFIVVRDFLIILDKACKEVKTATAKKANNKFLKKEGSKSSEQPRQSTFDNPSETPRQSVFDNPSETPRQSVSDNPLEPPCRSISNNNPLEQPLPRRSVSNNNPSESPRQSISDNHQKIIPAIVQRRVHSSSSSDDDSP